MVNLSPILPHETIFSWVTRSYYLSGFASPQIFYSYLFGTSKVRIHPFLNNRISCLSKGGNLSERELLWKHTLYPLFCAFNGIKFEANTYPRLLVNEVPPLSLFGLNQKSFFSFHGHKYCPECVQKDIEKYGVQYWHIHHQIPGVSACDVHNIRLLGVHSTDEGIDRKLVLPYRNQASTTPSPTEVLFSRFCSSLLRDVQNQSPAYFLPDSYRRLLQERKLITQHGQLRSAKIISELRQYWQDLPKQSSIYLSVPDDLLSFTYVADMIRNVDKYHCHPVKHLLFLSWLCDGKPLNAIKKPEVKVIYSSFLSSKKDSTIIDNEILRLLQNGASHNRIYAETGKSRTYIKRIASIANLYSYADGNKVDNSICRTILIKGLRGDHRQVIANTLGVSVGIVEQVLSSDPWLIESRKKLRLQVTGSKHKQTIKDYLKIHQSSLRKDVKKACNAAFFWCYNHDKEWLNSVLPKAIKSTVKKCDWAVRDDELVKQIKLELTNIDTPISVTKLDTLVGGKKWLTRFISNLPATKQLIYELIISKKVLARELGKYKPEC
jgi:hypothetical protein